MELELVKAKELAEAGSRAKSEFLANMSHEIRPLTIDDLVEKGDLAGIATEAHIIVSTLGNFGGDRAAETTQPASRTSSSIMR